jgi:hypothetical protein
MSEATKLPFRGLQSRLCHTVLNPVFSVNSRIHEGPQHNLTHQHTNGLAHVIGSTVIGRASALQNPMICWGVSICELGRAH